MGLQADSKVHGDVKAFKDLIIKFTSQSIGLTPVGFICASPADKKGASVLIPVVLDNGKLRLLTNDEAYDLNFAFNNAVLNNVKGIIQVKLSVDGSSGVYGIDFSNPHISHCVITKIIESSVINKDHELTIDPELSFRALSPSPDKQLSSGHSHDGGG